MIAAVWLLAGCAACVPGGRHDAADGPGAVAGNPAGPAGAAAPSSPPAPASSAQVPPLIESARWVRRGGRDSLEVIPSTWQREHPDAETIDIAWSRLLRVRPEADTPGLRDQYACHVSFAPGKAAYYLEPWRPEVGYPRTVAEKCNPGERKDLG